MKNFKCIIFFASFLLINKTHAEVLPWSIVVNTGPLEGIELLQDGDVAFFGSLNKENITNTTISNIGVYKTNGSISQLGNGLPGKVSDITQTTDGTIYAVGKFPGLIAKLPLGGTTWEFLSLTCDSDSGFIFVESINANELLIGMLGNVVNGEITGTVLVYNLETEAITPMPVNGWPTRFNKNGNKIAISYFKPSGDFKNLAIFDIITKSWDTNPILNIAVSFILDCVAQSESSIYVTGLGADLKQNIWEYVSGVWNVIGYSQSSGVYLNFVNNKLYATGGATTFISSTTTFSNYDQGWSFDPGMRNWESSNRSFPYGVKWMVQNGNQIYAGTEGGGVFKAAISTRVDISKSNIVQIYPNPTSGRVSIVSSKKMNIPIFNVSGAFLQSIELKKGKNNIELLLPSGIYFLGNEKLIIE